MEYGRDSLYHFGIFGMKWGVRRFQNEDGTLTEEGKKRYSQRSDQLEGAKYHLRKRIERAEQGVKDAKAEAKRFREQSEDKSIKDLWGDKKTALRVEESMDRIRDIIREETAGREAKIKRSQEFVQEERNLYKQLADIKVDAIESDDRFTKRIHDVILDGYSGFLARNIGLKSLNDDTKEFIEKRDKMLREVKGRKTLTQRFSAAQKDHPGLTYEKIYKEMKVNMDSDDPDDYKEAEDAWLKKHGY